VAPGEIVRRAREARGISQRQLAIRSGTTQTAISRLENGDVSPRVETLQRLLLVMGYRLDLAATPMGGILDDRHHDEALRRSVAERLARAAGWNEFASELAYAARRGKNASTADAHTKPSPGDDGEQPVVTGMPVSRPLVAFAALAAHDVEYVVIGGFAMQGHGHLRASVDVDLVLGPEAENLKRAAAALMDLDARIDVGDKRLVGIGPQDLEALADNSNLTLTTTAGRLHVWVDTTRVEGGRAWPELRRAAKTTLVGEVPITTASADDLIAITRVAAENRASAERRNRDLGNIAALTRADNPRASAIVDSEPRGSVKPARADLGSD
jgi:transcriptional regulator with XRE-family HTH domain